MSVQHSSTYEAVLKVRAENEAKRVAWIKRREDNMNASILYNLKRKEEARQLILVEKAIKSREEAADLFSAAYGAFLIAVRAIKNAAEDSENVAVSFRKDSRKNPYECSQASTLATSTSQLATRAEVILPMISTVIHMANDEFIERTSLFFPTSDDDDDDGYCEYDSYYGPQ